MAYSKSKGLLAVATSYSNGGYSYTKIDGYIQYAGMSSTPNQMQDLDSYVNTKGHLKRTVLEHDRTKIDFNTKPMNYSDMHAFIHILKLGMKQPKCIVKERKIRVRYYDEWSDDYEYMFCYIPDVEFQYNFTGLGFPQYLATRFAFIEY